jgi:hypothetical protein
VRLQHAALARELFEAEKIRRPENWVRAFLPGLALTSSAARGGAGAAGEGAHAAGRKA